MDIDAIIRQITEEVLKAIGSEQAKPSADEPARIAQMIDHTLLKPNAKREDVKKVCDEALKYGFASVCVNPSYIGFVADQLKGSKVAPCCVIGFPLGATLPEVKAFETETAITNGAKEIDMVINIGAVKSGEWDLVKKDIERVVWASRGRALVKVILETCLLTKEEIVQACQVSKQAGVDFVKTSTGFSTGGALVEDVKLMRDTVGPNIGVKASGGVRDYKSAQAMIQAGANRLGTSAGVDIMKFLVGDQVQSNCIQCGKCSGNCPVGRTVITKSDY